MGRGLWSRKTLILRTPWASHPRHGPASFYHSLTLVSVTQDLAWPLPTSKATNNSHPHFWQGEEGRRKNYKNSSYCEYFRMYKKKMKMTYNPTPEISTVHTGTLPGRPLSMHICSLVLFFMSIICAIFFIC